MPILTILLSSAAAWLGRWIQLHPEKILPQGHFAEDSTTAHIYRIQIACMGSFAVFAGTWSAVLNAGTLLIHRIPLTRRGVLLGGAALGVAAVLYVRTEVRMRRRKANSPSESWP
jgi:hypothetical protein